MNFGKSMLWFWVAYFIVTAIGMLHTVFNIYVLRMKPMDETTMGEGYEKTKPWHPLYNIVVFSLFGFIYMNGLPCPTFQEALITGAVWSGICIVFDLSTKAQVTQRPCFRQAGRHCPAPQNSAFHPRPLKTT